MSTSTATVRDVDITYARLWRSRILSGSVLGRKEGLHARRGFPTCEKVVQCAPDQAFRRFILYPFP
jgi:hypothetical protein